MAESSSPHKKLVFDIATATTTCAKFKNVLEALAEDIESGERISETRLADVRNSITSFYGAYPEDDTNWRHNLWAGKFFPILAFYGIYQMDEIDWTVPYLDQNAIIHLQVSS